MTTVNYWEDDWEEQLAATNNTATNELPIKEEHSTEKPSEISSWEDLMDDEQVETKVAPVTEVTKTAQVKNVWEKPLPQKQASVDKQEFPSLPSAKVIHQQKETERVNRLKDKSKNNIYEAFNDDEMGRPSKNRAPVPMTKVSYDKERPVEMYRPPRKSRFCKNGAECTYGSRCWWAHSEAELVPQHCNRGQNCRCIVINYSKEVSNNPRSRRICMYRHDETVHDYLIRTGQHMSKSVIKVPSHQLPQATEMVRAAGGVINVS
jgi:hypothetical protein